jgi:hypothetical protein
VAIWLIARDKLARETPSGCAYQASSPSVR